MTTHLIIPDSHAHPDFNNDRFTWLGKLIVDLKPDIIINLGDQADMPSLCSYDKGTKGYEGRRYRKDILSNIDANEKLFAPLNEYNDHMRQGKRKQYKPHKIMITGNHENRINRAIYSDPVTFEGTISMDDLKNEDHWDEVVPFLEVKVVDGIAYSHYFVSGVMGQAVGGVNPAASMLSKGFMSCTAGHSHTFDFAERTRFDGKKMYGLVAGVFQDYHASYAGAANALWSKGLAIKRNVNDGEYDLEWVSIEQLKEMYA